MPEKRSENAEILVGVVSDTHGRLPPQVLQALEGVSLIIHAGDLNTPQVLDHLNQANQLKVVRGNTDYHDRLRALPRSEVVQVGEVFIYVIHDLLDLDIDPVAAGFDMVIHGHLHVPEIRERQGVLYLNPGSPTFPRMGSAPGVALLRINGSHIRAELIPFNHANPLS
jgi:putative phosphoesterase